MTCGKTVYFRDDFSGEVVSYKNSAKFDSMEEQKKNQCHVLKGEFDGKIIDFHVTDDGMINMFKCSEQAQIRNFGEIVFELVEEE